MRLLVTGSRTWPGPDDVYWQLSSIYARKPFLLIHGGCPLGVDLYAHDWANFVEGAHGAPEVWPADWDKHGKQAGFIRNAQMVDSGVDLVVGFIHNDSRGGTHTVEYAQKKHIPTIVHRRYS